jgi:hypothetical protein
MAEAFRGMMMLEERYKLKTKQRETVHQGKSLYDTIIDVGITQDKQNALSKKHALSSDRGLAWDRGIKDIKTFNSHMPDLLRRLDWYFDEEVKNITPVQVETEQQVDYVKENQSEPVTAEQETNMRENYKNEITKEYEKIPMNASKLKSGKGKSVFAKQQTNDTEEKKDDDKAEEKEKGLEKIGKRLRKEKEEVQPQIKEEVQPQIKEEVEPQNNIGSTPTQEQEDKFKDFVKGAIDSPSKRYGLILIDKEGNIKNNYKSITEFKDDTENYKKFNKYKNNISVSKRQTGTSYIEDTSGDALYFVPLQSYRDHYETKTWLRRHKKLQKKKEDEKNN